jgi:hypothetical protein
MKSLFVVLFTMPVIAFGGTCYKATNPTYNAELANDLILVGSNDGSFPAEMKITNSSRHNEDKVNFTAQKVIANVWNTGCGDGFVATLKVMGEVAYGVINPNDLIVSVQTETTNDTCHSRPQVDVINYEIVK